MERWLDIFQQKQAKSSFPTSVPSCLIHPSIVIPSVGGDESPRNSHMRGKVPVLGSIPLIAPCSHWTILYLDSKYFMLLTSNGWSPASFLPKPVLHRWDLLTIELSSNSTWRLVWSWLFCLQNLPCLVSFCACVEVVWRFEQRTFYIGSWRAKLIFAPLGMPKWIFGDRKFYRATTSTERCIGYTKVLQNKWNLPSFPHYYHLILLVVTLPLSLDPFLPTLCPWVFRNPLSSFTLCSSKLCWWVCVLQEE